MKPAMLIFRPHWCVIAALGLALCGVAHARGQSPEMGAIESVDSPFGPTSGARFRANRDHGMSESARRFGREHQGVIILGIEPVLIHGRSLNRIKSLDAHGRVFVWIDDPQAPRRSVRREDDDGGEEW